MFIFTLIAKIINAIYLIWEFHKFVVEHKIIGKGATLYVKFKAYLALRKALKAAKKATTTPTDKNS